jgi:hypothetical protein
MQTASNVIPGIANASDTLMQTTSVTRPTQRMIKTQRARAYIAYTRSTSTTSTATAVSRDATPCQTCQRKQACEVKWKAGVSSVPTKRMDLGFRGQREWVWERGGVHENADGVVANKVIKTAGEGESLPG